VVDGLSSPIWAGAPEGDGRIFVAEKRGVIQVVVDGAVRAAPYLDISSSVSTASTRGLTGVAFHPDYGNNGYLFVLYSRSNGDSVVSRWKASTTDRNLVDPTSEQVFLVQPQTTLSHNGSTLAFGPDGYLYVGMGDGGSPNDMLCRGQDLGSWLGKILRIDVDGTLPGVPDVPPDNPFVGVPGALPEIYHLGFRNPWRFTFDRLTGNMYIGDVGEFAREEIDFAEAGKGGLNFGWRIMEGTRCNTPVACDAGSPTCASAPLVDPILEHAHSGPGGPQSRAVIGGYVYRGCSIVDLQGTYFFADFQDGTIRSFRYEPHLGVTELVNRTAELAPGGSLSIQSIASFGEDGFGELLLVDYADSGQGELFKIVAASASAAQATPRNGTGANALCFSSLGGPILGGKWEVGIDVSGHPGAVSSGIIGTNAPHGGTFVAAGEILIDVFAGQIFFTHFQPTNGSFDRFAVDVPCNLAFTGFQVFTQAWILGGYTELCNALDGVAGSW